jgi:hypothetical protein
MRIYLKHLASKSEGMGAVRLGGLPDVVVIAGHKSIPATFMTSDFFTPAAYREISFIEIMPPIAVVGVDQKLGVANKLIGPSLVN